MNGKQRNKTHLMGGFKKKGSAKVD